MFELIKKSTTMVIIFWDDNTWDDNMVIILLAVYQMFLSPQVKQSVTISNKNGNTSCRTT